MAKLLLGKNVAKDLTDRSAAAVLKLRQAGVNPSMAVVRVGERADDCVYEKAILSTCKKIGLLCQTYALPADVSQDELEQLVWRLSADEKIHGMFFFSPLPEHLDEKAVRKYIPTHKDIDSLTHLSAVKVYLGDKNGFAPCTAAAVMEILRYYQIPLVGANVTLIGRSSVVGKPLAMLLLSANATVAICHSKTQNLQQICRSADIIIAAVGRAKMLNADYVHPGQIVIDVGINDDGLGGICGDVDFASVEPIVDAITPVPGGIGSITTAVLCSHAVQAAIATSGADVQF